MVNLRGCFAAITSGGVLLAGFPGLAHSHGNQTFSNQTYAPLSHSKMTPLEPQFFRESGSKRVKVSYGPLSVPGCDDEQTLGMKKFYLGGAQKPCDDCLVTLFKADLEMEDGTIADASTGMWLHHVVVLNTGHKDIIENQAWQRVFASGNERSVIDMTLGSSSKTGYRLGTDARILLAIELMNLSSQTHNVFLTVEWEYVPSSAVGFRDVIPVWLDIGSFAESEVAIPNSTAFSFTSSPPATLNFNADIIIGFSHLHDAGIHTEIFKNNQIVCDSVAEYDYFHHVEINDDGREEDPMLYHHGYDSDQNFQSISSMTGCPIQKTESGDQWSIKAYYNVTEHSLMTGSTGELEKVMGIAILYMALH